MSNFINSTHIVEYNDQIVVLDLENVVAAQIKPEKERIYIYEMKFFLSEGDTLILKFRKEDLDTMKVMLKDIYTKMRKIREQYLDLIEETN